jgi:hypothetical protein
MKLVIFDIGNRVADRTAAPGDLPHRLPEAA